MRKLDFRICENKDADQPCRNCTAYKRLCFRFMGSSYMYIRNFKRLAFIRDCTCRFVSDLVGNPEDRFSEDAALIVALYPESGCRTIDIQVTTEYCIL